MRLLLGALLSMLATQDIPTPTMPPPLPPHFRDARLDAAFQPLKARVDHAFAAMPKISLAYQAIPLPGATPITLDQWHRARAAVDVQIKAEDALFAALQKARWFCERIHAPALSDDLDLAVDLERAYADDEIASVSRRNALLTLLIDRSERRR